MICGIERQGNGNTLDIEVSRVDEVPDPLVFLVLGMGLGHFVVVVGESEIFPSGVDVDEILLETAGGHDGALNVPAGSTLSPWGVPGWFSLLGLFPQCEVVFEFLFANEFVFFYG